MILSDKEISNICRGGAISPFLPELVNPASIDVRLGHELLIESAESEDFKRYPLAGHTAEHPYDLVPGQFVLAPTIEVFHLPLDIACEFRLKSSRAREGLDNALAMWIDPGFSGSVLTMELRNNRQLWPIGLWPGMRIGQLFFHRMSQIPSVSYNITGRYNNDLTVTQSKGH